MKALKDDTYVDDIQYGSDKVEALTRFKEEVTQFMNKGGFILEERSKTFAIANKKIPAEGSMVLIKDSINNTGKWEIGTVESQIKGKDGVHRGFKIRRETGTSSNALFNELQIWR